ncbi:MAG: energy transducer TonB [Rhodothermaceae bacterium]|nr:energy transducer TonB [Rhodothermaceae bacterium]MYD19510.1 energy transducer TonB [Rhodothermaceae bacterium]MYI44467.1 energy transducer TonB [Rhodothermaceae bacterium]
MASRESSIDDLPSNRPFSVQIGLIVALLLVSSILLISRWDSESGNDSEVYEIVEEMPELIGGLSGLQAKVTYPEIARKANVEGRVIVQFIVDKNGSVRDAKILRRVGAGLDEEASRVIMEEAKFIPGRQDGKPVAVRLSIPIVFKLRNEFESLSDQSKSPENQDVYEIVEENPRLIGGVRGLQAKVKYPEIARKAHVEGRVIVQLVVDENGNGRDAEILRGAGAGLDEEAIRVIYEHAEFTPGRQDGKPVAVRVSIPIVFKLDNELESLSDQSQSSEKQDVYEIVEQMPELIGGIGALQAKVKYPEIAQKAHVEGRVVVQFIVDENGDVRDAEVVRGAGAGLDEEATRVIMEEAKFIPGHQSGRAVPTKTSLPIVFKLR